MILKLDNALTPVLGIEPQDSSISSGEFLVIEPVEKITTKAKERRTRVHFDEEVIVWPRKNPPLDRQEIEAKWLQPEEIRRIRRNVNETLSSMRRGESTMIDETTHCTMGIEHLVDIKSNRRARQIVVNSVLIEQDLQRYEGIHDIELLANASREFSAEHRELAHLRGLYGQEERVKSFPQKILAHENRLMILKRRSSINPLIRCL